MKNQYTCGNLTITAPDSWKDITESVKEAEVPFTLAKDDGKGALQFSVAEHMRGRHPNVTLQDLDELRNEFAQKKNLGNAFDELHLDRSLRVSGGSYRTTEDYVRIWYCSNGKDLALVTYLAAVGQEGNEPNECDVIVARVRFG